MKLMHKHWLMLFLITKEFKMSLLAGIQFKQDMYYLKIESSIGDWDHHGTTYKECYSLTEAKLWSNIISAWCEYDGIIQHVVDTITKEDIALIQNEFLFGLATGKIASDDDEVYDVIRDSLLVIYGDDGIWQKYPSLDSIEIYYCEQELITRQVSIK